MKKILLLFVLLCTSLVVLSQGRTVTGNVTGSDDNLPIPGVFVVLKGTSVGTATDFEGNYSLEVPDDSGILVFSFIGMKTQEITIDGRAVVDVVMVADYVKLDEIIVTAYGTSKKGAFTGSAAQVNSDKIELRPITNIAKAIEGAAPGIQVTSSDGQPGGSQSIRVRGFGSFSASSAPLYVVDGVPFYAGTTNMLNPNDIESLTVLKDAASTALYGNKGANGVVLITTKKGRMQKGQIAFNISEGIVDRAIPEYELLEPDDYYEVMWESYRNSLAIPGVADPADLQFANETASESIFDELRYNPYNVANDQIVGTDGKINPNARLIYPDDIGSTNWEDALSRTGHRSNYDLSYFGGTDKSDYFVSLGYLDEKGYAIESDFKRFTGRAKVNLQATDWLKTGFNVSGTTSKSNQSQDGGSNSFVNPFRFSRTVASIYPVYAHDPVTGEYLLDANGNRVYDIDDNRPGGASTGRHAVAETKWSEDINEIQYLGAKTYADISFLRDFTFTLNASVDMRNYYNTDFDNKIIGDGAPGGRAYRTYARRNGVNFNQLLQYERSFGSHNFKVLAGHESYEYIYNEFSGARTELIADGNTELVNFVTTTDLESFEDTYNTEGFLGRVEYDFANKYFLSGSFRSDGSSKFSADNRWGNFWSLGGAVRLDHFNAIQNLNWIDALKLRASYGEVGNDAGIDFYAFQALYALGYNNQGESGYIQDKLQADALVWEANKSFDVALEFGLFNRLYGTLEFYHRISDNLLFEVPLPLISGIDAQDQNIGTMFNEGIELGINADIIQTGDLRWNVGVNFSTIKNEFTKLPQEEIINGSKKLMVGHSIYDYWLKEWAGVDPADGSALYRADEFDAEDDDIRIMGIDTFTIDQNNARYHYAGTAIPDFFGSVNSTVSYKSFDLGFMFTYQIGGEILDYNFARVMSTGGYGASKSVEILDRWQQPGDITNVPRMDIDQTSNFNATSDRWLADASYLKLKQVTLSYALPENLTSKAGISNARVYISGENLFSLTERKGMDVQQNFSGTTSNVYTPARIISFGANVKF